VHFAFDGFRQPVDVGILNSVKAGSAVPVKFSLSGNQGLNIFATGFPKATIIACDVTGTVDPIEQTSTAGNSSLSYDPVADQYTYVWKTAKVATTECRQLAVKLTDGTTHYANFKLLK
jgi:hypothetical protein